MSRPRIRCPSGLALSWCCRYEPDQSVRVGPPGGGDIPYRTARSGHDACHAELVSAADHRSRLRRFAKVLGEMTAQRSVQRLLIEAHGDAEHPSLTRVLQEIPELSFGDGYLRGVERVTGNVRDEPSSTIWTTRHEAEGV